MKGEHKIAGILAGRMHSGNRNALKRVPDPLNVLGYKGGERSVHIMLRNTWLVKGNDLFDLELSVRDRWRNGLWVLAWS